jgi:hypothetical protein
MKSEKQLLGYVLKSCRGGYYVSHTRPTEYETHIQSTNSFFHALLLTDKQAVKDLLEELDEVIDEKGFELLRFCKRGTNRFLLPASEEDLEGLPMIPC